MAVRLYDSAWVRLADSDKPFRVNSDARNPGIFEVGSFHYDIDGRPLSDNPEAPKITAVLSLQDLREAGISTDYNKKPRADAAPDGK